MQALGLIETRGLLVAVESADTMLKAADVTLLEKTYVGGGLVSIIVTGDVAAVKSAIEAGAAAVGQINSSLLVTQHVIPRPHEEMKHIIVDVKPLEDPNANKGKAELIEEVSVEDFEVQEKEVLSVGKSLEQLNKSTVDNLVIKYGLIEALNFLKSLKVAKLRSLAREFKSLGVAGRTISKADKKMLLELFNEYYESGRD